MIQIHNSKVNSRVGRKRKNHKKLPPHLREKSGRYYYVININGRTKWFNLKTSDESEALRRWAELEIAIKEDLEFSASELVKEGKDMILLSSLAERYINKITSFKSLKQQGNEQRMKELIVEHFGKIMVNKITRQDIMRWHDSMRNKPYEANRRLALLRHMLQKALDWGYLNVNPAYNIKKHKEKRHKLKLTTDILFKEIYPVSDPMLKGTVMFTFNLVQHEYEIKNLKWNNINHDKKVISFIRHKTDVDIVIDYSENNTLSAYIDHLKAKRKDFSPYIIYRHTKEGYKPYASFASMWERALEKAGCEKIEYKFKEIRHLANTCMKEQGIIADKRISLTGHKSIVTNEIYTHPTGKDSRDGSKALGNYSPEKF